MHSPVYAPVRLRGSGGLFLSQPTRRSSSEDLNGDLSNAMNEI
jgi:hypothetical protein